MSLHQGRTVLTLTRQVVDLLGERHALDLTDGVRVRPPAPDEQATLILVGTNRTGQDLEVLAHRALDTGEGEMRRNMAFLQMSSEVQYRAFLQAREAGGLLTVHHHPGREFFSGQDRQAIRAMNWHLSQIAPGAVHVTLVFGSGGVVGEVWESPDSCRILDEIRLVGADGFGSWVPNNAAAHEQPEFVDPTLHDRTLRVYGREVLEQAARLRYGLVGVGGLGSILCDTLKFLGKDFVLVDQDRVERHNGARLAGYRHGDEGRFKTELLRRCLLEYNPGAQVQCVNEAFPSPASREALKRCDILLCGPDADWVRYETNRFAARYLKPAFFLGSEVKLDSQTGQVRRIVGQLRFFHPDGPCCVCQGLQGVIHSPQVVQMARRVGYIPSDPSAATPSIVTVNQAVANLAVTRLLRYLAGEPLGTNFYYDETNLRIDDITRLYKREPDCPFCGSVGCSGLGDVEEHSLLDEGDLEDEPAPQPESTA